MKKIREYLEEQKAKCQKRLDDIAKEVDAIKEKNDKSEDEVELKELGDTLAELEAEKAEKEAELAEIEAQIEALDKPADGEGNRNGERKTFLNFEQRGGNNTMNEKILEERKTAAEEFRKTNRMKIEKPQLRAVTIASGTLAIPTEVHGIENPADVAYSTILDFVKVEDMTGAGYNKVALLKAWASAGQFAEGAQITPESNPTFGTVTISPINGFKVLSSISNEVLKTSPLNYYGKVEESAMVALRKAIAAKIVTKAVGAVDDAGAAVNASYTLDDITETTLRDIAFQFGGDEGIYGPATLLLNKKDLIALGDLVSATTKEYVYEIEPNAANPNIGVIRKGGLSARYILTNALPAFVDDSTEANTTCMIYGDMKSIEVDLFGAYDLRVSEDFKFDQDLLAIRGTAQVGVGVTRLHGLIEVKKSAT